MPVKLPSTWIVTVSAGFRLLASPSGVSTGAFELNGSLSSVLIAKVATRPEPATVAPFGTNLVPGGLVLRLMAPLPGVIVSGSEPTAWAKTGTETGAESLFEIEELLVDWKVIGSVLPPNWLSSAAAPETENWPTLIVSPPVPAAPPIWKVTDCAPTPPARSVKVTPAGAVRVGCDWNSKPGSVMVKREPTS